jgi:hypothetical protein
MQVVSVVSGIFFKAKIELAVRRHGTNTFCNSVAEVETNNPEIIIVDLEHPKAHEILHHFGKRCVAFGPHLRTDLLAVAREFGARTFPRSVFFNELDKILSHQ